LVHAIWPSQICDCSTLDCSTPGCFERSHSLPDGGAAAADAGNEAEFERLLEAMRPEGALRQEMVAARLRAGLSQAALARRMGTGQSAIARLESGRGSPSFTTLRKLAEATGSRLTVRLEGRNLGE
jgi:DNA-binding XRE family transcriptional regulator